MAGRLGFAPAVIVAFLGGLTALLSAQMPAADTAFEAFWSASSPEEGVGWPIRLFAPASRSTRPTGACSAASCSYGPRDTGVIRMDNRTSDGVEAHLLRHGSRHMRSRTPLPGPYQLHGGVGGRATNAPVGNGTVGALAGAEQIYVVPYAWAEAPWWSPDQVLNLAAIVDRLKRLYNVDENRVVLSGVSDGATGALYVARRETTPFASILPLNGYVMVLALRDIDDGLIFLNNLRNKPLFAVNGGRDPLYPTRVVEAVLEHLKGGGVSITTTRSPTLRTTPHGGRGEGHRSLRARAPAQAAAGHAHVGDGEQRRLQPGALAHHRPARRAEERQEDACGFERHADAPSADFGARASGCASTRWPRDRMRLESG
jgi:hypothetical protein